MEYLRRIVDREIAALLGSLAAVSIEGPKGVGKTETAKRVAKTIRELDDPAIQAIASADVHQLLRGEKPILLDEWQRLPALWDAVRRAVDTSSKPNQFLFTGSANPANPPTHSGAGRIVTVRMRPLALSEREIATTSVSFAELMRGNRAPISGDTTVGLTGYVEEIVRSGFPGMRQLSGRALRAQLGGYLMRIVDRDFQEQGLNVRNPEGLRRWMAAYAAATSTTASFEAIRDASTAGEGNKPAKTTVQPYKDILERLWILEPIPAWVPTRNHLSGLAQPPKHQLADPALAAQLLGLDEQALIDAKKTSYPIPRDGTLLGNLFESLVTLSIRVLAQSVESKVKHLRTKGGQHEVDLIVERSDQKVLAIEVKLSSSINDDDVRNLKWLERKIGADLLDAIVINTGPTAYRRKDGVAVIPASLIGL
jgi:predicted AAA+ superfamily ATPase